jgi:hypothetical protein
LKSEGRSKHFHRASAGGASYVLPTMSDADDEGFCLELDCEASGRSAIIDDMGDSVWLLLTPPGGSGIDRDCWLFNTPSAPAEPDLEKYESESVPPPVPARLMHPEGAREVPAEERWSARWSDDGHSVVVAVDGIDIGVASASEEKGMSRYLLEECGWGRPWNDAALKRLF